MSYAFVKNVLNIQNEEGKVDQFIKITSLEEFNLYEFLSKIQLLKYENPFHINMCFDLNDIINSNIEQLNADIISIISDYTHLGEITFVIRSDEKIGSIVVDLHIILNKPIKDLLTVETSVKILNKG